MEYSRAAVPTIKQFMGSDSFQRMLMGPFGSGKSSGTVHEITRRACLQAPLADGVRRTRWAVIRNTYQQLRDTTIKTFLDWYPEPYWGRWSITDHTYSMRWQIADGSIVECEILFRALDRPDQVGNLLSLELTGAWCNEAREIPKVVWEALQGRVGRFPAMKDGGATWWGVIGDTNPPDNDHWIYTLFEETRPENAEIFKQPSGLSPEAENIVNLPADYYRNLAVGKGEDFVRVYIEGQYGFVQDGKPVYPEYSDTLHCREFDVPPSLPVYRGWDWGLTPACVYTAIRPNGQWLIFDEVIATRMGAKAMAQEVNRNTATNWNRHKIALDVGDPAGKDPAQTDEKTCFQVVADHGIDIVAGDQNPAIRTESVRQRLTEIIDGEPAVLVHPRCRHIRKGFMGGYRYRRMQTSQERYTDKPEKNEYSHPHDALQYVATRLFQVQGGSRLNNRLPRVRGTLR